MLRQTVRLLWVEAQMDCGLPRRIGHGRKMLWPLLVGVWVGCIHRQIHTTASSWINSSESASVVDDLPKRKFLLSDYDKICEGIQLQPSYQRNIPLFAVIRSREKSRRSIGGKGVSEVGCMFWWPDQVIIEIQYLKQNAKPVKMMTLQNGQSNLSECNYVLVN